MSKHWQIATDADIAAQLGMDVQAFQAMDADFTRMEAGEAHRPFYEGCLEGLTAADVDDLTADERAAYEAEHPPVAGFAGVDTWGGGNDDHWADFGPVDDADPFEVLGNGVGELPESEVA